jgi:hypothetical protein
MAAYFSPTSLISFCRLIISGRQSGFETPVRPRRKWLDGRQGGPNAFAVGIRYDFWGVLSARPCPQIGKDQADPTWLLIGCASWFLGSPNIPPKCGYDVTATRPRATSSSPLAAKKCRSGVATITKPSNGHGSNVSPTRSMAASPWNADQTNR